MIADTYRVAIQMSGAGIDDKVVNVIHVRESSALTPGEVAASVADRWSTCFKAIIPTLVEWNQTTVTKLNGSAGTDFPWDGDQPTDTSASMPMNAALCMSWRTILSGRSHRGRSYIGPIGANLLDASVPDMIDSTYTTAMVTNGSAMLAGFIADNLELVVASYVLATADGVVNVVPNPRVCTMRKRVNGR